MIAHGTYTAEQLGGARRERSVTVCAPARNEVATIGRTVAGLVALRERGVVDHVLVLAGDSRDGTEAAARSAGATVIDVETCRVSSEPVLGKGDAMWRGLSEVTTDVVAFVDADLAVDLEALVCGLVGPLVTPTPSGGVVPRFVKGAFRRHHPDFVTDDDPYDGGRVTEMVARPLLNLLRPDLVGIVQPLGGQVAGDTSLLRSVPFLTGYAVEIGMLLDVVDRVGVDAVAQVDLGDLVNRPRSTGELAPMAQEVLYGFLLRTSPELVAGGWRPYVHPRIDGTLARSAALVVERPPLDGG